MNKKEQKEAYKQQQREAFESGLPMERVMFEKLFDYLDEALSEGCDDTLRLTVMFLHNESIMNIDEIIEWLNDKGGYCDCEVLANVEELFE